MFQVKIVQWNCFKLSNEREMELKLFLKECSPDILSIQEIKLTDEKARILLNQKGYTAHIRSRKNNPSHGGGVAVLVRSGIPHTTITGLDESLEIIGLKIEASEVCFDFFSLYNPPNRTIPYDFFTELEKKKSSFILVGDLNDPKASDNSEFCVQTDSPLATEN